MIQNMTGFSFGVHQEFAVPTQQAHHGGKQKEAGQSAGRQAKDDDLSQDRQSLVMGEG